MYIEFEEEEYEIFNSLREGGITRGAAFLQILETCDSFDFGVRESEDDEEYEEVDLEELKEIPETEETEQE